MLRWFKEWQAARDARIAHKARCDGFGWAMTAYYIELLPLEEIELYSEYSLDVEGLRSKAFDKGALEAVQKILHHQQMLASYGEPCDARR